MIVYKNTHSWQTNSEYPDSDFLAGIKGVEEHWIIPDDSELAAKIRIAGGFEAVTDEEGNLTDIIVMEPDISEQINEAKNAEFEAKLAEIDRQAIRPLRAIAAGTATDEDREILAELERQAGEIRAQLAQASQTADLNAGKEDGNGRTDNKSRA